MSVSDWSMDVAIYTTNLEERMSCYDVLSQTWVQVALFSVLYLGYIAFLVYLERRFVNDRS